MKFTELTPEVKKASIERYRKELNLPQSYSSDKIEQWIIRREWNFTENGVLSFQSK